MADYTITLGSLIERGYYLPMDDYPIYDENHREALNNKIYEHFWFREIGQETPDKFAFMLRRKMHEIMPVMNQFFETELIEYNPLATDFFEIYRDTNKDSESSAGATNTSQTEGLDSEVYGSNKDSKGNTNLDTTSDSEDNSTIYRKVNEDNLTNTTSSKDTKTDGTKDINTSGTERVSEDGESHTTGETTNKSGESKYVMDTPQVALEGTPTPDPVTGVTQFNKDYASALENNNKYVDEKSQTDSTVSNSKNTTTSGESNETNHNESTENGVVDTTETKENKETGNTTNTGNVTGNQKGSSTENEKQSYQRRIDNLVKNGSIHANEAKALEKTISKIVQSGRRGFNPSELIDSYRNNIINVDLRIIDSLNILFLGVY